MLLYPRLFQIKRLLKLHEEEGCNTLNIIKNINDLFIKYVVAYEERLNPSVDQNSSPYTIYYLPDVLNILSSGSNSVIKTTTIRSDCEFSTYNILVTRLFQIENVMTTALEVMQW